MIKNNHYGTLLSITGIMLILFICFRSNYIIYAALALILISLISPGAGQYISRVFIFLMKLVGKMNMYLFTFLFFYIFLLPIGLILQFTSKKISLSKNKRITNQSYFNERDKLFDANDFENPW